MTEVIWHDVECGGYAADLGLWAQLAAEAEGPILDLGCGTGRVALHLARSGHEVLGVDVDPALVAAFEQRARGLPASAIVADARELGLGREFALVLAPMQLVQLLAGEAERGRLLAGVAAHLQPGGLAALAIAEQVPDGSVAGGALLPDTREIDGTVYSSLPLDVLSGGGEIAIRRLRQVVAPGGELSEEEDTVVLRPLSASRVEREASPAGLEPLSRRAIPPTEDHVGSTVVVLRKAVG